MEVVNKQEIIIDLRRNTTVSFPYFTQFDTNTLDFIVKDKGVDANLSGVTEVVINFKRSDKQVITRSLTAVGNVVTYTLGTEEMKTVGYAEISISFFEGQNRLSTRKMKLYIGESLGPAFEKSEGMPLLQELFVEVAESISATTDAGNYAMEKAGEADQAKTAALEAADSVQTNWLQEVSTIDERDAAYPEPQEGDTVRITGEARIDRFNGTQWVTTDRYNPTAIDQVTQLFSEAEQNIVNHEGKKASAFETGHVRADGVSIVVDDNGVISAIGTTGGGVLTNYDPATTYAATDVITYGGEIFVSRVSGNTGNTPGQHPDYWKQYESDGFEIIHSRNLYNPSLAVDGKALQFSDGQTIDYPTSAILGRFRVTEDKTYTISIPSTENGFADQFTCYDINGTFLGISKTAGSYTVAPGITDTSRRIENGWRQKTFTIHSGSPVAFVDINIISPYVEHTTADFDRMRNSIQIEEGSAFTEFEPYNKKHLKLKADTIPTGIFTEEHMDSAMKKGIAGGIASQDDLDVFKKNVVGGFILPLNKNKGEGTASPTILPASTETTVVPTISMVPDTDSPMKGILDNKRRIFRTTAPTTSNYWQGSMPDLSAKPTSINFGFWIKDSDVNTVYDTTRLMEFWIYQSAKYIKLTFNVKDLIIVEGKTVSPTATIQGAGLIDSYTATAVCLNKDKGYSFISVKLNSIVWNAAFTTGFTTVQFYYILTPVRTQLQTAELNITNFILLYNDVIESGKYVYGDGANVIQQPPVISLQKQIIDLDKDIDVKINDLSNKPVKVTIDNTQTSRDVAIRTPFSSDKDLVHFIQTFKQDGKNDVVNPLGATLINKSSASAYSAGTTLQSVTDDAAPANFNGGYIGANHGYARTALLTLINHGKTFADIGSEWTDGAGYKFYILKIVDANNILLISEDSLAGEPFHAVSFVITGSLTHSTGAVNTATLTGFTHASTQLYPAVKNHTKKVMIDGVKEVSSNGDYQANFVDIVEFYEIVNPYSMLQNIIANKPVGGYTSNPNLGNGDAVALVSNVYRFLSDGTMLVIADFTNVLDINMGYIGLVQQGAPANAFGGAVHRMIPKTLPITVDSTVYDLRVPRSLSLTNPVLNYTSEYWQVPTSPPDRSVDLFRNANGENEVGFALGYLPIGDGINRKDKVSNAWFFNSTKKNYPHFVDTAIGSLVPKDRAIQGVAYRKFFDIDNQKDDISFYTIPNGATTYVYIDVLTVTDSYIELPKEYLGKQFDIVEKSSNVTVFGSMVTDKLRVRAAALSPMYGYAVLKVY